MACFKGLYRGHGVYWHRSRWQDGYGDETNAWCDTVAEYHAKIDAEIAADDAARAPHLVYWDTLDEDARRKWRKACQCTELSASELAYTNSVLGISGLDVKPAQLAL